MDDLNSPKMNLDRKKSRFSNFQKTKPRRRRTFQKTKGLSFSQSVDFRLSQKNDSNTEKTPVREESFQIDENGGFAGIKLPEGSLGSGFSKFSKSPSCASESDIGTIELALSDPETKEQVKVQVKKQKHISNSNREIKKDKKSTEKNQGEQKKSKGKGRRFHRSCTTKELSQMVRGNPKAPDRVQVDIFGLRTLQKDPRMNRLYRNNTTLINSDSEFKFLKPKFLKSPTTVFRAEPIRMNQLLHIVNQKHEIEQKLEESTPKTNFSAQQQD